MSFKAWWQAMAAQSKGRVVLRNLRFDLDNGRLDAQRAFELFTAVGEKWKRRPKRIADENEHAIEVLEIALDELPQVGLCCGPPVTRAEVPLSRVTDASSVDEWMLRKGSRARISRHRMPDRQPGEIIRLRAVDVRDRAVVRGGRRPMAWVTMTEILDALFAGTPPGRMQDVATEVRNMLGLIHQPQTRVLVEIMYPDGAVPAADLHGPTALDGACTPVYRSTAETDRWGRAVHLGTLKAEAPEAVHPEIRFTERFLIRFLGAVRGPDPAPGHASLEGGCHERGNIQRLVPPLRGKRKSGK